MKSKEIRHNWLIIQYPKFTTGEFWFLLVCIIVSLQKGFFFFVFSPTGIIIENTSHVHTHITPFTWRLDHHPTGFFVWLFRPMTHDRRITVSHLSVSVDQAQPLQLFSNPSEKRSTIPFESPFLFVPNHSTKRGGTQLYYKRGITRLFLYSVFYVYSLLCLTRVHRGLICRI